MRYPPRIIKITYRSAINGRVASVIAKVPYAGLFALSDTLARALAVSEVMWYRIEPAKPIEIERVRPRLARWLDALRSTTERTRVTWQT